MPDEQTAEKYVPECYACPIGTMSMKVQGTAPEATEHMIRAGRELLAAARSVLEGLDAFLNTMEERSSAAQNPKEPVQAIPIRRGPKEV